MADIEIFQNENFGKVRTLIRDGEPWFVANDVAAALGYAEPKNAVAAHCKYAELFRGTESVPLTDNPYGIKIIPESDVYALIFRSNLPKAEAFRAWVCEEVLPAIRKTGQYSTGKADTRPDGREVVDVVKAILVHAKLEPNQVAIGMSNAYRHITGVDALAISGIDLPSPIRKQALTPTQLGKELGEGINAREVNRLLTAHSFQEKRANGGYDPTILGEPYALMLDTAKRHSDGTPVKQLKWYTTILPIMRGWIATPVMDTDEGE